MRLRFWGVRGSIACALSNEDIEARIKGILRRAIRENVRTEEAIEQFWQSLSLPERGTYGGNTACVTVRDGARLIVLDAGTGLRLFGEDVVKHKEEITQPIHILLSHYHWDHIGGFPFFAPAFQKGTRIVIHCPTADGERHFHLQQSNPFSPAEFAFLAARIEFQLSADIQRKEIAGFHVSSMATNHPGGCMAYRIQDHSGGLVYMTDTELATAKEGDITRYTRFFDGATLAIVDAMYGLVESYTSKLRWGHSSIFPFIDMVRSSSVRVLVLFHHDPSMDDQAVEDLLQRARRYYQHSTPGGPLKILSAYDGLELDVPSLPANA